MKRNFRTSVCVFLCCLVGVGSFSNCDIFRGDFRKLTAGIDAKQVSCDPGKQFKSLTLALTFGPTTFNPYVDASPDTNKVSRNLFATLLDYNFEKNKADDTGLATAINAEGNGKAYTVQLRKCLFSDGTALKADDVVYSYSLCLNEGIESMLGDLLRIDGQETKVTATDDLTVKIEFPVPIATDVARLIFARIPIVQKKSFEAIAKTSGGVKEAYGLETPPAKIVTSGPFKVKSLSPTELVLEANEKYWKTDTSGRLLPYTGELKYLLNLDRKAQTERFAKGDLDVVNYLAGDQFKSLSGNSKVTVADKGNSLRVWALVPNTRIDKRADPNKSKHFLIPGFRWAMSLATNRDRIIQNVAGGSARTAYNMVSPGNSTWFNGGAKTYPYNLEAAKTQFTAMQYKYAGTELKDPGNQSVKFTITYPKDTEAAAIAKELLENYKAVGINVKGDEVDYKQWWRTLTRGSFDTILVEMQPEFPDPAFLQTYALGKRFWVIDGPIAQRFDVRNGTWFQDVTKAFGDALKLKSTADRKEQYNIFQAKWGEQCPIVYIMSENMLVGAKSNLGNVRFCATDPGASWNLEEFFVK